MEDALTALLNDPSDVLSAEAAASAIADVVRSARARFSRHIGTVKKLLADASRAAALNACSALADAAKGDERAYAAARVSLDLVLRALAELPLLGEGEGEGSGLSASDSLSADISDSAAARNALLALFSRLIDARAAIADVFLAAALRLAVAGAVPSDAAAIVARAASPLIASLSVAARLDAVDPFRFGGGGGNDFEDPVSTASHAIGDASDAVNNDISALRRDALRRLCVLAKLALALAAPLRNADALALAAASIAQGTSTNLTEDIAETLLPRDAAAAVLRTALTRVTGRAAQALEGALSRVTAPLPPSASSHTAPATTPSARNGIVPAALVSAIFGEGRATVFDRPGRPARRPVRVHATSETDAAAAADAVNGASASASAQGPTHATHTAASLVSLLAQTRAPLDSLTAARSAAYAEVPSWRVRSVRHAAIGLCDVPLAAAFCGAHAGAQRALMSVLSAARRWPEARGAARALAREGRMGEVALADALQGIAAAEAAVGGLSAAAATTTAAPLMMMTTTHGRIEFWAPSLVLVGQEGGGGEHEGGDDDETGASDGVSSVVSVTVVTTAAGARAMGAAIARAAARAAARGNVLYLGLDAEWRPPCGRGGTTPGDSDALTPVAVLQLATYWNAWVIDVRVLRSEPALPAALRSALCADTTDTTDGNIVVTGLGVCADLDRLTRTLPSLRGARFAWLDVLRLPCTRGAAGLSAVAERLLGAPLDKALQTSDWAARPLSWGQLRYAALDALAAARAVAVARAEGPLPPHECTVFEGDITLAVADDNVTLPRLGAPAVADALTRAQLDVRRILRPRPRLGAFCALTATVAADLQVKTLILIDNQGSLIVALLPERSRLNFVRAAAALGGGSLRLAARADECVARGGFEPGVVAPVGHLVPPAVTLVDARVASAPGRIAAGGGDEDWSTLFANAGELLAAVVNPIVVDVSDGGGEDVFGDVAPPPSPALTLSRPTPLPASPLSDLVFDIPRVRFVVDSSLNRLTRWLRAIGIDTEARDGLGADEWRAAAQGGMGGGGSCPGGGGSGGGGWGGGRLPTRTPLTVDELISYANDQGRVILTRDAKTLARRDTGVIFWVEDADIAVAFTAVCDAFALSVRPSDLMSRCSACNGGEYVQVSTAEVRAQGGTVTEALLSRLEYFWRCTRCAKLYWEGEKNDGLAIGGSFSAIDSTPEF